jgi:adenylate kinase family enzyme
MTTATSADVRGASRILVDGVTGSGKSTLAAKISAATGIDWYSVDDLMWEPGWVVVPRDEQRRRISSICDQGRWILDSAYGHWADVPVGRADLIIGLDYPRWLSYGRLLRRTVDRLVSQRPVCNGNTETLRNVLAKDSLLVLHIRSFGRNRQRLRAWEQDPAGPRMRRLGKPAQAPQLVEEFSRRERPS